MKLLNGSDFSISAFFIFLVYASFIAFLGYSAALQGLSHYYAEFAFRSGSEASATTAIRYQPDNPAAQKMLGEVLLSKADYSGAAAAFESAIASSPNDFLLWLRLGYSRSQLKELEEAEKAFQKALELAPHYSQPNQLMGMMLLESSRKEHAFRYLSKAADRDPELYPQMLDLALSTFPNDPLAIERASNPKSRETQMFVASYLIKHNFMTDNVRSFLVSDALTDGEKNEFVQSLLHNENFETAREVWLSRLKPEQFDVNNAIFDGGFEAITENDPSGLGWQINQTMTATAVARDPDTFHLGSNSLRIRFAGNAEIGKDVVSQLAYVQPGGKYSLRVFVLSLELVSAGPPSIAVNDGVTNALLGRSNEFKTTAGKWVEYRCEFVGKKTPVVRISVQRINCGTSPCPIFGDLFLDDFRLLQIQSAGKNP